MGTADSLLPATRMATASSCTQAHAPPQARLQAPSRHVAARGACSRPDLLPILAHCCTEASLHLTLSPGSLLQAVPRGGSYLPVGGCPALGRSVGASQHQADLLRAACAARAGAAPAACTGPAQPQHSPRRSGEMALLCQRVLACSWRHIWLCVLPRNLPESPLCLLQRTGGAGGPHLCRQCDG